MIVYRYDTFYLKDLYEYGRIVLPYPTTFTPSVVNPGTYDILIDEGQKTPITNIFMQRYATEPGIRTGANYNLTLSNRVSEDYGEYLELTILDDGESVADAEIKVYYNGDYGKVLPVMITDEEGKANFYLPAGLYELRIRKDNVRRTIRGVEVTEGIAEYDGIEGLNRVSVVRFLRRPNRLQGNIQDQIRVDPYSNYLPNIMNNGFTRIFDEDGALVYIGAIDETGKSMVLLEENKRYIMYHDKHGYETVAELVDTSYSLKGRANVAPEIAAMVVGVEPLIGGSAVRIQSTRNDINVKFAYKDSRNDRASSFQLQLLNASDLTDARLDMALPIYNASQMNRQDTMSFLATLSGMSGFSTLSSLTVSGQSGMSATWFNYDFQQLLESGSYILKLKVRDSGGIWSEWSMQEFEVV